MKDKEYMIPEDAPCKDQDNWIDDQITLELYVDTGAGGIEINRMKLKSDPKCIELKCPYIKDHLNKQSEIVSLTFSKAKGKLY